MKLPKLTLAPFKGFLNLIRTAWKRDLFNKIYMGLMPFFMVLDLTHDSELYGMASLITVMLFSSLLIVTHHRIIIAELQEKLKDFETD